MGRPGWDHRGLPCEPGRCLCQDIALLAQLPVLTPQTGQLLALGAGRAVLSAAFVAIGLPNPVPDRLGGRFELARQRLRCSPRSDQINHLSAEFRRIGSVTLRHRWHLLLKWKGVHQTGSTPEGQTMAEEMEWFVGVDWGSQSHQVCLFDARGECLEERAVAHGGPGIEGLGDWLIARTGATPELIGVAIEITHGPVVEALLERGFCVYAINPKQLDRFRDRFTVAGAKDDRRDAQGLGDSLRTDRP